uniref:Ovule protein n=1 Tax=Ascaris lumbricoides TaxID=6252 RepID=A0A0M3IEG2_ASCLU
MKSVTKWNFSYSTNYVMVYMGMLIHRSRQPTSCSKNHLKSSNSARNLISKYISHFLQVFTKMYRGLYRPKCGHKYDAHFLDPACRVCDTSSMLPTSQEHPQQKHRLF